MVLRTRIVGGFRWAAAALALAGVWLVAAPAQGAIPGSLHAPANCTSIEPVDGEEIFLCDDGTAPTGGLVPNVGGVDAVTVPAKYGGDGYTGLPASAGSPLDPGADANGNIALDTDVWLPSSPPPAGGYPLIVHMHGCCGGNRIGWGGESPDEPGERWHYNAAWFAMRGYAVISYTARGFVNSENRGSTGFTQLDSRRFEINDYQHLACQVMANASDWNAVTGQDVAINPAKVVATGGSYGGGWSWLALTDPKWTCNAETGSAGTAMKLAAVAPKYGWTDLAYTLVPNGHHSQSPGELPATNGCDTGPVDLNGNPCANPAPVGVPKSSIISGLYVTGNLVTGDHTTFPPDFTHSFACLTATYPIEANPGCGSVATTTLPEFVRDRSAYYQNDFFANIASDPSYRVPVFNAAAFTDPLFPSYENRRMHNRLLATVPGYPIKTHFGDYQHFTQNKPKEWGDICDSGGPEGRHVCTVEDYPGGDFDAEPVGLVRRGITSRLNDFIDHYAQPASNPSEPAPVFDVAATLQSCVEPGAPGEDEPGPQFTARTFEALAPNTLTATLTGEQMTLNKAPGNRHAVNADPIVNERTNGRRCPRETDVAGLGVASYATEPLPSARTMIGSTEIEVDFSLTGAVTGLQLNARLYDLAPDGTALMVDRGTSRIDEAEAEAGTMTLQLHGNGWRFRSGHRLRVELMQDDQPYVRATDVPSSLALSEVRLTVPVREAGGDIGGGPEPKPRCGNRLRGTRGADRIKGTPAGDKIRGKKGSDRLRGRGGRDCVKGGRGADRISGGPARDRLAGGRGNDRIRARDGSRDIVICGRGRKDRATLDGRDKARGCERVKRA